MTPIQAVTLDVHYGGSDDVFSLTVNLATLSWVHWRERSFQCNPTGYYILHSDADVAKLRQALDVDTPPAETLRQAVAELNDRYCELLTKIAVTIPAESSFWREEGAADDTGAMIRCRKALNRVMELTRTVS